MSEGGGPAGEGARRDPTGLDAYRPAEIARLIERAGVAKSRLALIPLVALGMLAGAFIAFGALAFLGVLSGADAASGPTRLLAGIAFSLGLVLVVIGGAELFTGNALIVMAWVDGLVPTRDLLRNWGVVYVANAVGAGAIVVLAAAAGLGEGGLGKTAVAIAERKAALEVVPLVARGILCNALVCLAVWMSFAARDVAGKVVVIVPPITAFVLLGLEHSIANMFLLPFAALAGGAIDAAAVARNLFWVTLGNIIGGAGGVALAYRAAYGGPPADQALSRP